MSKIMLTYNGITRSLLEWSKIIGISKHRLYQRIYIEDWSVEQAMNTPLASNKQRFGRRECRI